MDAEIPTSYQLRSAVTGMTFTDTGWMLDAPGEPAGLLKTEYEKKQLTTGPESLGLYRFSDWLPIQRILQGSSAPVTYKSAGLAAVLGLNNLYITFSGFWPEKGAGMRTCSFKETEAYSVCARLAPGTEQTLVVASAGNTARAFAQVCSDNKIPLLLCVPANATDALWFDQPLDPCVRLLCTPIESDYFDAIQLSNKVCNLPGFIPEGGAKNVARRDGMATTVLSAATFIGRIPDYYFQAVGSGTGAIAAHEANLRLIRDGRFGTHTMKLVLSQNAPFLPMYDAWMKNTRALLSVDEHKARTQIKEIIAKVLSNRNPPYSIPGGLYDALSCCKGTFCKVTNEEAVAASRLFEHTEGIDIHPAAAVATASLITLAQNKMIPSDDIIMLNITGGGESLFKKGRRLCYLEPEQIIPLETDLHQLKVLLN
ncbi:MAG TPA: cysteate synthase [Bacteroidales bacterium]|nr:cysteate synthase [Bacteroidales bacterium]HPS49518.1 cysteate synthase [Bacteroidales bacterium]